MKTQLSSPLRMALMLAAIVIVLAGIKTASALIVPFILSVFLAIVCNPALNALTQRKVPKGLGIALIISCVVLAVTWLANLVGKAANDFSTQLPAYQAQLSEQFSGLVALLAEHNFPLQLDQLTSYFDPGAAVNVVTVLLSGFGSVMANLFLVLLTVIFMLSEASCMSRKFHVAFGDRDMRVSQIDEFLGAVNQYLAIKTMVSIATGTIISLVLWAIGLDYWVLWGVLACLLNFIPNIGSIIAAVPAVLLAVIQLGVGWAGGVVALYLVVNIVMGNAVEPRFLGRGLGLSTLIVFLSLIFWGWLLGTVGMLLSVPLTMIIKIGLESHDSTRWFAMILGEGGKEPIKF
ncbi:MAG: AI-2E family transporter [Pseudomonadales bacterium]